MPYLYMVMVPRPHRSYVQSAVITADDPRLDSASVSQIVSGADKSWKTEPFTMNFGAAESYTPSPRLG